MDQLTEQEHRSTGNTDYDAVPRDGPAVFIADTTALERGEGLAGAWIDPTQPAMVIEAQLRRDLGHATYECEEWAIVDQVGLGEAMVPHDLTVAELEQFATSPPDNRTTTPAVDKPAQRPTANPTTGHEWECFAGHRPDETWADASELGEDFIDSLDLPSYFEGLPGDWPDYLSIDTDKLGAHLAQVLDATIGDDGSIYLPGANS